MRMELRGSTPPGLTRLQHARHWLAIAQQLPRGIIVVFEASETCREDANMHEFCHAICVNLRGRACATFLFSFAEYPVAWPTPPKRLRRLDCGDEGEENPP